VTVADHYLFDVQYEAKAKVRIWDLDNNCAPVGELLPGPEVDGRSGTIDIAYGVFAFKRPTGEIIIFVENNWMANVIMYRWTPPGVTLLPEDKTPPAPVTGVAAVASTDKVTLSWNAGTEKNLTYCVYRGTTAGVTTKYSEKIAHALPTPTFDDIDIETGGTYYYRVTAMDNSGNESVASAAIASNGTGISNGSRLIRPSDALHAKVDFYTVQGRKIVTVSSAGVVPKALKSGCFIATARNGSKGIKPVLAIR
jgi:hypothetical protein